MARIKFALIRCNSPNSRAIKNPLPDYPNRGLFNFGDPLFSLKQLIKSIRGDSLNSLNSRSIL